VAPFGRLAELDNRSLVMRVARVQQGDHGTRVQR